MAATAPERATVGTGINAGRVVQVIGPVIDAAFDEARGRGNEGLMVKDPDSSYSVGRRGFGWLKMKRALATIDAVVVGVEVGHGKRHGVLSDYTFAVRDTQNERLVTIGKAYTGLTDAEIAEMTRWFEEHTLEHHGRYRVVEPSVVVEVAFVLRAVAEPVRLVEDAPGFGRESERVRKDLEDEVAALRAVAAAMTALPILIPGSDGAFVRAVLRR